MKKCPVCFQLFDDSNDYCLNDGTRLVIDQTVQVFGGFPISGDVPTQYIPRPQSAVPNAAGGSPRILYGVIGVLATALVAIGVYLVFLSNFPMDKEVKSNTAIPAPTTLSLGATPFQQSDSSTNFAPPLAHPINSNLTPAGNWSGDLTYASGSAFSATVSLDQNSAGQISGQIVWTLTRTANPKKMGMAGQSATEYVSGTFDSATGTLMLAGTRKSDPANMIILDKYRLAISQDGRFLTGASFGGRSKGKFRLQK